MNTRIFGSLARMVLLLALASTLIFGTRGRAAATGDIIHVKWNATGANNGATWADAYTDLQSALGVAINGDQIWVAKGTYKPTGGADQTISFHLKNGVAILGGFAGTETRRSQRNPTLNLTILSGDISVVGTQSDNSYHVVQGSYTDNTAVLDGFKIVGGYDFGGSANYGGGIYNYSGSPTLSNLVISGNIAYYGGGIGNEQNSSPVLTNVTISGNFAGGGVGVGGGMINSNGCNPVLTNVTFSGNEASFGGALENSASNPTLTNVTFNGNIGNISGGAIYNDTSNPTLTNVTFSGNTSPSGDGIFNANSNPHIYNSILWGDGTVEMLNSGSSPIIANSIVKGGCPAGSTCKAVRNSNPVLGPLQNNGGFTQTMALGVNSSAIDAGNRLTCAETDQRGVKRPQGAKCDMGAFEVKALSYSSQAAYDGWVLESAETSGVGGSLNSSNATFRVGDNSANRQYRGVLSFNTASLPNTAKVVRVTLKVKRSTRVGTNPFKTHQGLLVDIRTRCFGTSRALASEDFQASASRASVGTFGAAPVDSWYKANLSSKALSYVSKTGITQFRLRFKLDDDNDHGADYIAFFSGDTGTAADRPTLWVYYLP